MDRGDKYRGELETMVEGLRGEVEGLEGELTDKKLIVDMLEEEL